MTESDILCSITVSADGVVVLRHAKNIYESNLLSDRRANLIVERFDRLAKEHPTVCRQPDLRLLGETLFGMLFGQPAMQIFKTDNQLTASLPTGCTLGDVFLRIVDAHKCRGPGTLRVSLVFEEGANKWANRPWEFLYVFRPDQLGFFVAGEGTSLSLTRIIEPPSDRQAPSDWPHMLVILAQPRELNFELAKAPFEALLDSRRAQLALPNELPEQMVKPTWTMLTDRLADKNKPVPDIIHFIGHGRFQNGESQVALHLSQTDIDDARARAPQREPAEADWRSVGDITAQLVGRAIPWLFFLQTCNSGRADGEFGAFRGAAQQIAQAGVPFVVAMQYEIAADDAVKFADTFYTALGAGGSVDEAVMRGRDVLGRLAPSWGHPRFATPVVYLRSERGVLGWPRLAEHDDKEARSLWPQNCPKCSSYQLTDKRKWCKCGKWRLVYCEAGHVNAHGDVECGVFNCLAPIEEYPSAPRPAPRNPLVA